MTEEVYKEAAQNVTAWYRQYGRDLPWRRTGNPYHIWISEIMLQQTQVDTVKPYYERFIETLPTVEDLAGADEQRVFKLWEGLGYYRRASHLKEAASMIVNEYHGRFPETYEELLKLKGVGMYTASAIASIAFGIPKGVVDGNTLRIVARLFNREDNIALQKTKNAFGEIMDAMIRYAEPSDFNQGMMDLGAMICTPSKPSCDECPVASLCQSRECQTVLRLPVNNKVVNKSILEYMTVVIRDGDRYFMVQNEQGLLQHLYGFAQYGCDMPSEFEKAFYDDYGVKIRLTQYISDIKHVFTHREWRMHVYGGEVVGPATRPMRDFYKLEEIEQLPVSTAHLKVLKAYLKVLQ
ncbi:MAG: A/G-specific adenine glycosylase [Coprococcus catus]|nr:A/G-specific adenine glycosylase [Coprococcus catus]